MPKRNGFTLIEVMVSVVIISTVILALLELIANNAHIFRLVDKKSQSNQYISLMVANPKYGFENKRTTLYNIAREFNVNFDLRHKLKAQKVKVKYQELKSIDTSEFNGDESDNNQLQGGGDGGMVFETGRTIVIFSDSSSSLFRIKLR